MLQQVPQESGSQQTQTDTQTQNPAQAPGLYPQVLTAHQRHRTVKPAFLTTMSPPLPPQWLQLLQPWGVQRRLMRAPKPHLLFSQAHLMLELAQQVEP